MKKIDVRFDENTMVLLRESIGKTFKKYKCDPFDFVPSVYGIIGIFIDEEVYKLTNFCEVLDYYGYDEDVAVFKFVSADKEEIKTCIVDGEMIDTPVNSIIEKIHIINEHQKLYYNGIQTYDVWVTRGIIFFLKDGREISYEKNIWFSEFISIQKGYDLEEKFESTDVFDEGWEDCEGYETECTRERIVIE